MPYMPVSSKERVKVSWPDGSEVYPVGIAIVLEGAGEPADDDYHAATWDAEGRAVLLVGSGSDVPLPEGEYVIWTRITAGDEQPVRRSGVLTVGTP